MEMKWSFVILYHLVNLVTTAVCTISASDNAKPIVEKGFGHRVVRSIDSILDTLASLESQSSRSQSQSESVNTNSRPYNAAFPGRSQDPNQRQSSLFTEDKNSKGSRASVSSQHTKRPSQSPSSKLSQGHRRLDHNFPMIPFPYPPLFGAFPGMEHNRDSKQSSFPQNDRSSYGSKSGGNGNHGKATEDDSYRNEYPNTKYSMLPTREENPGHKDHEILKPSGYPSSKVFFPSHGIPSPQEISIPMFSQGRERGYGYTDLPSRDGHGQQPKHTSSHGSFDDLRDLEKSLGFRREPHGNHVDQGKGQLSRRPYDDGLLPNGDHSPGRRYGEGQSAHGGRYGGGQSGNGESYGNRYGGGQSLYGGHTGQRYGESQSAHGDNNPGRRYEGDRYGHGDHQPGHRNLDLGLSIHEGYGTGPSVQGIYEDGQSDDFGYRNSLQGGIGTGHSGHGDYGEGQFTNSAHRNLGLGQSVDGSYGGGQLTNSVHGNLGADLSAYEGYGVGPSALPSPGGHYPAVTSSLYPGTNSIWRGFGQDNYGTDDNKARQPSVNEAALQALSGISSFDPYAGTGGIGLGSSYNQFNPYSNDLTGYGGLFR